MTAPKSVLTEADLQHIEHMLKQTTKGDWATEDNSVKHGLPFIVTDLGEPLSEEGPCWLMDYGGANMADGEFVVSAHNMYVPELLATVRAHRASAETLLRALAACPMGDMGDLLNWWAHEWDDIVLKRPPDESAESFRAAIEQVERLAEWSLIRSIREAMEETMNGAMATQAPAEVQRGE